MRGSGMRSLPMRKFSSERWVCAPQYRSAGTSIAPMLSRSVRVVCFGTVTSSVLVRTKARILTDRPFAKPGWRLCYSMVRRNRAVAGHFLRRDYLEKATCGRVSACLGDIGEFNPLIGGESLDEALQRGCKFLLKSLAVLID